MDEAAASFLGYDCLSAGWRVFGLVWGGLAPPNSFWRVLRGIMGRLHPAKAMFGGVNGPALGDFTPPNRIRRVFPALPALKLICYSTTIVSSAFLEPKTDSGTPMISPLSSKHPGLFNFSIMAGVSSCHLTHCCVSVPSL